MAVIFHRQQMLTLLETGQLSDVTLVVGLPEETPKEFKVLRLLLSTFSPVFKAIFSHEETKEALEKRVVIEDVSASAMDHLLKYIYSGVVPVFKKKDVELLLDFLVVVDKYQVDLLKVECERQLSKMVTFQTVYTILQAADLHSATELKEKCLNFIVANSDRVISRSEGSAWQQLEKIAHPQLIKEVLYRLAVKRPKSPLENDSDYEFDPTYDPFALDLT